MLDKKHYNWNGCCIHVLTHVTQGEAVACLDHEKYCQIECPSTCHPKFDIMCVWRPGNRAIFTQWIDHCQIHVGLTLCLDNRAMRHQISSVYT